MQDDKAESIAAGMDEFLTKPIRLDSLTKVLASCPRLSVNKQQPQQQQATKSLPTQQQQPLVAPPTPRRMASKRELIV